jgi:hypothetical protein
LTAGPGTRWGRLREARPDLVPRRHQFREDDEVHRLFGGDTADELAHLGQILFYLAENRLHLDDCDSDFGHRWLLVLEIEQDTDRHGCLSVKVTVTLKVTVTFGR